MKTLLEYLVKNHVNNDVNVPKYHWPKNGISDSTYEKCKENTHKYQHEHYGETNEDEAQMIKDLYKDYLNAENEMPTNKLNQQYDKMMEYVKDILLKKGSSTFEQYYIGQGWFHYINWRYENKL